MKYIIDTLFILVWPYIFNILEIFVLTANSCMRTLSAGAEKLPLGIGGAALYCKHTRQDF